MIVHDLLEKRDDELIGMLKSIQNEPIDLDAGCPCRAYAAINRAAA